jgi:hypothetical protein
MRMCVLESEICNRAELVCAREMMLKTSNKQKMRRRKEEKEKKNKTNK